MSPLAAPLANDDNVDARDGSVTLVEQVMKNIVSKVKTRKNHDKASNEAHKVDSTVQPPLGEGEKKNPPWQRHSTPVLARF